MVAAGVVAGRLLIPSLTPQAPGGGNTGSNGGQPGDYLDLLNENVVSGGPPKDGIPSIDNPRFVSVSEADEYLRPSDVVFGIDIDSEARAYPQRVLVWHEIVNDSFRGRRISVTYCPLTGSQLAFEGRASDGSPLTFGTTGKLVNSNLLMYDRQSDSNWPQILGTAISGERRAQTLTEIPLVWTTWGLWKQRHPETAVLSTDTGFLRNYSYDPYGSYDPAPHSYYDNSSLWFPVLNQSDRFRLKEVVFGVRSGGSRLAVPLGEFRSVGVDNVNVGGTPLALFHDPGLDTIGVFKKFVEGQTLSFELRGDAIVDVETETVWSAEGVGLEGPLQGTSLQRASAFNVMWFAWYAFHPDTGVYG